MEEKKTAVVTVSVECSDDYKKTLSGDTAIVFTVSGAEKFMNGDARGLDGTTMYIGNEIPDHIFAKVIADSISSLVKTDNENPVEASYYLFAISERLAKKSKELSDGATDEQMRSFMTKTVSGLVDCIFNKG